MKKKCAAKGFSLLELLTVLLMLGVVVGIAAPAVGKLLSGLEFRKEVEKIASNLRAIRLQAVVSGQDTKMQLQDLSLLVSQGKEEQEEKNMNLNPESELTLAPEVVIFTPQSTVTPATISFALGNRSREIVLDPLTALPIVQ